MEPEQPPAKSTIQSIAGTGFWVCTVLSIVLSGLNIRNSMDDRKVSELGFRGYAPENLRTAAESLEVGLAVDLPGEDVSRIKSTQSWRELEDKLDGYATRLALMNEQQSARRLMIGKATVVVGGINLLCILIILWGVTQGRKAHMKESEIFRP